jgi:hypothetical protein
MLQLSAPERIMIFVEWPSGLHWIRIPVYIAQSKHKPMPI